MAFKFKTKKRPSATQAFAGGFAQGVSSGIQQAAQLSLQDRLKRQEDEKNRLKRELDLFNGMVSNVEQTQANREAIMRGKRMIIASDGKTGASTVFSSVSPDFQFMPSKEEKEAAFKISEQPDVARLEREARESIDMVGGLPAPGEEEIKRRVLESDIERGTKKDPTKISSSSGGVTYSGLQKTIEDYQDLLNPTKRKIGGLPPLTENEVKKYNSEIDSLRRQQNFLRTRVGGLQSSSAESTKTNIPGF